MAKTKRTKGQTTIYKTLHRKLKIEQRIPQKTEDELGCFGRVTNSCSTCGTRRVVLVTNPVISNERGKYRIVITTNATYTWSFVTQMFRNFRSDDINLTTRNP